MDTEYNIECPICDIHTVVRVQYEDEMPRHCPMCGADVESEIASDDE